MSVDGEGNKSVDYETEAKVRSNIRSGSSGGSMRSASLRELTLFLSNVRLEHYLDAFRALGAKKSRDLLHVTTADLDDLGMSILVRGRSILLLNPTLARILQLLPWCVQFVH